MFFRTASIETENVLHTSARRLPVLLSRDHVRRLDTDFGLLPRKRMFLLACTEIGALKWPGEGGQEEL